MVGLSRLLTAGQAFFYCSIFFLFIIPGLDGIFSRKRGVQKLKIGGLYGD
jgi:hypothetical protein